MRPEHAIALGLLAAALGCGASETPFDAPRCGISVATGRIAVVGEDRYDVLFVVDDSPSMAEEQASLQRELPALVRRMLDGGATARGPQYPPVTNAHIGVVSADLGTAGIVDAHPGCSARGDDGLLQHAPRDASCSGASPQFLSYEALPRLGATASTATPQSVAADLACIALPGTAGCGYTQPLESALRALSPAERGEREHAGFLRSDARDGLSAVVIVIVTDQDDCSVADASFFEAPSSGTSPAARCAATPDSLFPVARYVEGLRALRAGNEQLVMLSVIAGVPEELVAAVPPGFGDNPGVRDRFYDAVLSDPRMQASPRADGTLTPVCESEGASATPAPRLIEAARGFGTHASVLSICQPDWSQAIDALIRVIARQLGQVCLPRPMPRSTDGRVSCEMVWELPPVGEGPTSTPTRCEQVPGLLTLDDHRPSGERGGQRCVVRQLAVTGPSEVRVIEPGFGWYYDDFSDAVQRECTTRPKQRIELSPGAEPPLGVQAWLECVETRVLDVDAGQNADAGACRVPG